eukprot:scaffold107166_cov33-Tisochrysis_lutea.AAC.3
MVDGNAFAATLLRPTINGVVVPTLSIALGTLLATTVNVLRDRQVLPPAAIFAPLARPSGRSITRSLTVLLLHNMCHGSLSTPLWTETGLLRLLRGSLAGAFGTRQHRMRRHVALFQLHAYCDQIIVESSPGAFQAAGSGARDSSRAYDQRLDVIAALLHGVDGAAAARPFSIGQAADIVREINQNRAARIAALLATFPPIHWLILSLLSFAIVSTFLIESNQDVLQYLNSLQLRSAFTVLIAVISATSVLCLDLNDPFRGYFRITGSVEQIRRLRDDLEADMRGEDRRVFKKKPLMHPWMDADEVEELTIYTGTFARREWGLRDTLYFHIMTGRFADRARAIGDVVALIPLRRRLKRLRGKGSKSMRDEGKIDEQKVTLDVPASSDRRK